MAHSRSWIVHQLTPIGYEHLHWYLVRKAWWPWMYVLLDAELDGFWVDAVNARHVDASFGVVPFFPARTASLYPTVSEILKAHHGIPRGRISSPILMEGWDTIVPGRYLVFTFQEAVLSIANLSVHTIMDLHPDGTVMWRKDLGDQGSTTWTPLRLCPAPCSTPRCRSVHHPTGWRRCRQPVA